MTENTLSSFVVPTKPHAKTARNRAPREYETVRLVTDKYKNLGLAKGEVGTVVDIMTKPVPGYTVEFHRVPSDNLDCVKTFYRDEIELVENLRNE